VSGLGGAGGGPGDDLAKVVHLLFLVRVGNLTDNLAASLGFEVTEVVEALTSDASGKVQVLLHDCDASSVNGAEIGIFEEASDVALRSLLQSQESLGLEAELPIDPIADSSHEPLERSLGKQEVGGLLVALDLAKSDSAWSPADLLLHAAFGRCCILHDILSLDRANGPTGGGLGLGGEKLIHALKELGA
jgi:hypothetical protein